MKCSKSPGDRKGAREEEGEGRKRGKGRTGWNEKGRQQKKKGGKGEGE